MDVVWARFGAFEMSIDKVVAGTRMVVGKNLGHNHPVSRLSVLLSGNQQVRIDGQEQSMRAGTALLVPGHVASSCYTESVVSRLHVDIRADEPDLAPILDSVGVGFWAPSAPIMLALGAYVRTLMVHEYREASSRERALIDATLKAVVIPIIVGIPPATHADAEARGHRAAALHHIRSHFVDPALTPTAVAAALGVSVRTLQRQFAADVSVHDWIVRTRLDHALSLLRDPLFATVALTDIAQRSGFGSLRGFRRAVVQATGMTPSDFRGLHSGHEAG
jgi:AraC-like DNA-binding protein